MTTSSHHEIPTGHIIRDTRKKSKRIFDSIFAPEPFRLILIAFLVVQLIVPSLWPLWIIILFTLTLIQSDYKFKMPMRMPRDIGGLDRSDTIVKSIESRNLIGLKNKYNITQSKPAAGVIYLGEARSKSSHENGRELWLTVEDAKTHMMLFGTTGSGKTETLLSLSYNALLMSGLCYADGKGDATLPFSLWSLARLTGREDDFLVMNFLDDKGTSTERVSQSNTFNPFEEGSADFIHQLITSLLPNTNDHSGDWQEKAINLMSAIITVLCHKRDKGEITISINVIRHYLALDHLLELYKEGLAGEYPEMVFEQLKSYFESGLPGFKKELVDDKDEWSNVVHEQHGFLTGQFARPLSLMIDSYNDIFGKSFPEIDMRDVLLNNRILMVLIPSLAKSPQEAASLGKLYIAAIKLAMSRNLGYKLEGNVNEILEARGANFPYPNIIISDEISYYFAEGVANMFSQARSLGFMMVAAMQDVHGLYKVNEKEANAMFSNTKVKWVLAMEDSDKTYKIMSDAAGDAHFSVLSGHETKSDILSTSYKTQDNINIARMERIPLHELKALNPGEGVIVFKDNVIRSKSLYIDDEFKRSSTLPVRINRFVQVANPDMMHLPASATSRTHDADMAIKRLRNLITGNKPPATPLLDDPILDNLAYMAGKLDNIQSSAHFTQEERGHILYVEAINQLKGLDADPRIKAPYHQADFQL